MFSTRSITKTRILQDIPTMSQSVLFQIQWFLDIYWIYFYENSLRTIWADTLLDVYSTDSNKLIINVDCWKQLWELIKGILLKNVYLLTTVWRLYSTSGPGPLYKVLINTLIYLYIIITTGTSLSDSTAILQFNWLCSLVLTEDGCESWQLGFRLNCIVTYCRSQWHTQ